MSWESLWTETLNRREPWTESNFLFLGSTQWKGKMELHLCGCLLRALNLPLQGRRLGMCAEGCYNFRVSQIISKGNSATMVLLKVYLTRWFYFLPQKFSKGPPLGWEKTRSSRSFDNFEIQRCFPLEQNTGWPPALWMKWGGGMCPAAMRTGRKWPTLTHRVRAVSCWKADHRWGWNSFTADLRATSTLSSSLPQGKNTFWH